MATHDINAICSQLLTSDDLNVDEKLFITPPTKYHKNQAA